MSLSDEKIEEILKDYENVKETLSSEDKNNLKRWILKKYEYLERIRSKAEISLAKATRLKNEYMELKDKIQNYDVWINKILNDTIRN